MTVLDVGPRCVEVGVVGHDIARLQQRAEEDALGRAPLVGGDDVLEAGDAPRGGLELVERLGPGVALVAQHHARPLAGGHRPRAGVSQQVDEHVLGAQQEQVVARLAQQHLALLARRLANGFDGLDAKGFDDGFEVHGKLRGK